MKKGLDYFSLPCVEDEKIELIEAELGLEGFAVIVKLLGKIYGQNGYYCQWDSDCAMLFARKSCISYDFVNKVVDVAIKRGFFCHALFEKYGILTSSEIQQFFLNAAKRRKEVVLDSRFICVNESISDTRSCNTSEKAEKAAMEVTAEKAVCKAIDADGFFREEAFLGIIEPEEPYVEEKISCGEVDINAFSAKENDAANTGCNVTSDGNKGSDFERKSNTFEKKKAYGRYGNVILTDGERAELGKRIRNADDYIDRFSQKLKDKGYRYADHYSALLDWWKRDSELSTSDGNGGIGGNGGNCGNGGSIGSFDTDEFFSAAIKRGMKR